MEKKEELQQFLNQYKSQIKEAVRQLKPQQMPLITEELFALFEKTGNRLEYESVYFTRRKFLAIFGMAAILEKQEKGSVTESTLKKLEQVICDICAEECWALPAHVDRKKENWQITVDLFASETTQTLAELADRLVDDLSEATTRLMIENCTHRVLTPFFSSAIPYGGGADSWETAEHNWNAVCGGAIGSACLHLWRQEDILPKDLDRIVQALTHYIAGFSKDGVCMEGLGYYTYGMTYFSNFAEELYEYTKGEINLLCESREIIAAFQGKCYFPDGRTVSFSDGNSREHFRVGLSCLLSHRYPQVELPGLQQAAGLHEDSCYRFAALKMDLLETRKYLDWLEKQPGTERKAGGETLPGALFILPDAQWCIASSANGVGMACKGGHNGEPHNHNDVGHFLYEADGIFFLTDLGAGEYTREYFGPGRYQILCNRSLGHSVPIINGKEQGAGTDYACTAFKTNEQGDGENALCGTIEMELSAAYEKGLMDGLRRTVSFDRVCGRLEICDTFMLAEKDGEQEITENLITQIKPQLLEDHILLEQDGKKALLKIEGIHPSKEVVIQEYAHSNHQGEVEKVYAIQWVVRQGRQQFHIELKRDDRKSCGR